MASSHDRPFTTRERATILSALRMWQKAVPEKEAHASSPLHFASCRPLSRSEIDSLCERLNATT